MPTPTFGESVTSNGADNKSESGCFREDRLSLVRMVIRSRRAEGYRKFLFTKPKEGQYLAKCVFLAVSTSFIGQSNTLRE